ncbi:MAG: helix-turn-helix transcriptional regulator [bacterium]
MSSGSKQFGARIKELREEQGLTQENLAENIGVEYQTINRIENGVYFTNYNNLENLAKTFNVSIDELFNYSHLNKKPSLIKEINIFLENSAPKELEFIYKFIRALRQYKK